MEQHYPHPCFRSSLQSCLWCNHVLVTSRLIPLPSSLQPRPHPSSLPSPAPSPPIRLQSRSPPSSLQFRPHPCTSRLAPLHLPSSAPSPPTRLPSRSLPSIFPPSPVSIHAPPVSLPYIHLPSAAPSPPMRLHSRSPPSSSISPAPSPPMRLPSRSPPSSLPSPVPMFEGFTMPPLSIDSERNAMYKQVQCRPTGIEQEPGEELSDEDLVLKAFRRYSSPEKGSDGMDNSIAATTAFTRPLPQKQWNPESIPLGF